STVVGNDLLEHGGEGGRVDGFALADGHGAGGLVAVTAGDDPIAISDDAAVVEEYVDVVPGRQQRTDVALKDKVRLAGALDGLGHRGVGAVDQPADLLADVLLPGGQAIDVGVHAWVAGVGHRRSTIAGRMMP